MKMPSFPARTAAFAMLMLVAACAAPEPDRAVSADAAAPAREAVFACGERMAHTRFDGDRLTLRLGGESYALTQVRSGSGARYEGQAGNMPVLFWNKGREAILEIGGQNYPTCRQVDDPSPAAAAAESVQTAEWVVEDLGGKGIVDRSRLTMRFGPDGQLTGRGGCNRYGAGYDMSGGKLKVGPVHATRMSCAPALMAQETAFLDVLATAVDFQIRGDGALVLEDPTGRTILARRETP